jgi:glutaconate CoA-transferase subunit A
MGVSFIPGRNLMGTDTFKYSAAKAVKCPFTGQIYCLYPALWPDVAAIHVHEADIYGNARIKGISIAD